MFKLKEPLDFPALAKDKRLAGHIVTVPANARDGRFKDKGNRLTRFLFKEEYDLLRRFAKLPAKTVSNEKARRAFKKENLRPGTVSLLCDARRGNMKVVKRNVPPQPNSITTLFNAQAGRVYRRGKKKSNIVQELDFSGTPADIGEPIRFTARPAGKVLVVAFISADGIERIPVLDWDEDDQCIMIQKGGAL